MGKYSVFLGTPYSTARWKVTLRLRGLHRKQGCYHGGREGVHQHLQLGGRGREGYQDSGGAGQGGLFLHQILSEDGTWGGEGGQGGAMDQVAARVS